MGELSAIANTGSVGSLRTDAAAERIHSSRIPLRGDWRGWRVEGEAQEVLRPEKE